MGLESGLLKRRWTISIVLTILASFGVVASIASVWTHEVLFDTDTWVETVGPVGTDEVVTDALSDRFSGALIDWVDAENRLESLLPPILAPLADYGSGFINDVIVRQTSEFFQSEFYANAWVQVNQTAHAAAVAIIRDEVPNVSTAGGVVTVDLVPYLTPIVDRVFSRVSELGEAIPEALLNRVDIDETVAGIIETYETEGLPDWLSAVEVYSSDRLAAIQQTTALLDRLVWILPVVTILFAAGAIYFAPDRWLMGAVLLGAAAVGWLLTLVLVNGAIETIVSGIDSQSAAIVANEVFQGVTGGLKSLLVTLVVVATLGSLGVVAWNYMSRDNEVGEDVPLS